MREIAAIVLTVALGAFAITCYVSEQRRIAEKLTWDIAQYWRVRRLHERREAALQLREQHYRASREEFYKRNGFYPPDDARAQPVAIAR